MSKLTDSARGRECQIRVPFACLRTTDTTVACHVRMADISGMSLKAPDIFIAFGCFACHEVVDGRRKTDYTPEQRRTMLLEGMMRTQAILWREGLIR